ncbi:hypothetical protein [Nevskia soli]|uniref:hypothetical protein n=1 Tax=Nevskia soli TaxID=418856 RepID=UPI0015D8A99C|nr:hypothetical protein [Nevskia soli]
MARRDLIRESVKNSILFTRHVVPATVRPARTLWNEVIGFVFFVFAAGFGFSAVRAAMDLHGDPADLIKLVFGSIVCLVMTFYGFLSFRKARRISRS